MVSAPESRKITRLIEALGFDQRRGAVAASHVENRERAEDIFAAGMVDERIHGMNALSAGNAS